MYPYPLTIDLIPIERRTTERSAFFFLAFRGEKFLFFFFVHLNGLQIKVNTCA
jgi:hypothetical protein